MRQTLFLLIFLLLFVGYTSVVSAQEETSSSELTPTPIEYTLPYSGLLPDHPLYSLKTLRDKIISFLIADSLKKAEFNLLQADKRLQGALGLADKGKEQLAESTLSKGANYFEQAVIKTNQAKQEGKDVKIIVEKLSAGVKIHKDVIKDIINKVSKENKEKIESIYKRMENYEKEINKLGPQGK